MEVTSTGALSNTFEYAYDAVGNPAKSMQGYSRTTQTATITSTQVTTYAYDAANRLSAVSGQPYTWDNNGNLINDGTSVYAYDQANRLTNVTATGLTWSASYNGDGARLKQIVNGAVTTYTLDLAAPLVQVLVQKDSSGDTRYLYGVTRVGEQQPGGWLYHLSDALGSVRQLADATAKITLARGYTPYGEPLWMQGTASSRYAFTGEDYDPAVGLVFLRARYMQPRLGMFLSRDPVMVASPYRYVSSNPINRVDPTGYIDWEACIVPGVYGTCTIQSGDSLYDIARQINAAQNGAPSDEQAVAAIVGSIIALNPQYQSNPNNIPIGGAIKLPTPYIGAVIQSHNPPPPEQPPMPNPPIWLPPLPPISKNLGECPTVPYPVFVYSEGAAAVATALFGQYGAWMGVEVVYDYFNLEKVTFDVRGFVTVRQSIAGVYESDYYAFAGGTSSQKDLRESYRGHFINHCGSVTTPIVSGVGLVGCGFGSPDGKINGQSYGTFTGIDFSLPLPPPFSSVPGFGYTDLDYNYLGGVTHKYASASEMKSDILSGADSPLYPSKISTGIVQPIIAASRNYAAILLDLLYSASR